MSQEALALARRAYELFTSPESIFSSEADAVYPTIATPDAEIVVPPIYPDAERSYRGLEGWRRWWRLVDEVWEDFGFDVERLVDPEPRVVALVRTYGVARQSATPVSIPVAHVWTFRDERVMRIEVFLDRAQGLAAAGIDSHPRSP